MLALADLFSAVIESQQDHVDSSCHQDLALQASSDSAAAGWTADIYVINLRRRPDRREYQERQLREAGLLRKATFIDAVDGRELSDKYMRHHGLAAMPNWPLDARNKSFVASLQQAAMERSGPLAARELEDMAIRHWRRPVTRSEVGCTLSHLSVWERICEQGGTEPALVFEDDAQITPRFKERFPRFIRALPADWDVLHLIHAPRLPGWYHLPTMRGEAVGPAEYEWLTLAYAVSSGGACKLADALDRRNVIPSDEFLPAVSAPHPRPDVQALYQPRIKALACRPLPHEWLRQERLHSAPARGPFLSTHQANDAWQPQDADNDLGCGLVMRSELSKLSDIEWTQEAYRAMHK